MSTQPSPKTTLVQKMLVRGYGVAIERGLLVITPTSGLPVSKARLAQHRLSLVTDILQRTGQDGLVYTEYYTGKYGDHLAAGVTLNFQNIRTGANAYSIFNVKLTRSRNAKHGKRGKIGDPLPEGQFNLKKGSLFIKFWDKSGANKPASKTEFYKRMGNLKGRFFIGSINPNNPKDNKLINGTIEPLEITHKEILHAYNLSDKKTPESNIYRIPVQPAQPVQHNNDDDEDPFIQDLYKADIAQYGECL